MKSKTMGEVLDEKLPTMPSMLGDRLLVPGGRSVIYGAPGNYKSYAAQQLCCALATGGDWLGYPIEGTFRTLYVQAEIPEYEFQQRTRQMATRWPDVRDDVHYYFADDFVLKGAKEWDALATEMLAVEADLVILDPLSELMWGNELSEEHVDDFLTGLNWVRKQTGAHTCFVHHATKDIYSNTGAVVDRGMAGLSGRGRLMRWPDTIIRLTQVTNIPDTFRLIWQKARHTQKPPEKWLHFNGEAGIIEIAEHDPRSMLIRELSSGPKLTSELDKMLGKQSALGTRMAMGLRAGLEREGIIEQYKNPDDKREKMARLKEKQ